MMRRSRLFHRQGLTLLELLIAVFIVLLITGIAIPVMSPSIMERRQRETSRAITSFLQGARTRAIQTGRPFGVMIEPQAGLTAASVLLSYAEVYPPWAGDTLSSRAHIIDTPKTPSFLDLNGTINRHPYGQIDMFTDLAGQPFNEVGWRELVRPGDLIRFNYSGHYYAISSGDPFRDSTTGPNANGVWDAGEPFRDVLPPHPAYTPPNLVNGFINGLPWTLTATTSSSVPNSGMKVDTNSDGNWDGGSPPDQMHGSYFQVIRQPTKTAAEPLLLSNTMVVDLANSSCGAFFFFEGNDSNGDGTRDTGGPITLLFGPSGALTHIFYRTGAGLTNMAVLSPTAPVFLLVGTADRVESRFPLDSTFDRTYRNREATRTHSPFWVTIHPQTGLITATEAGPGGEEFTDTNGNGEWDVGEPFLQNDPIADPAPLNGRRDGPSLGQSRIFAQRGLTLGGR